MQLELGKRYVMRDGTLTGPLRLTGCDTYRWGCGLLGYSWEGDGHYWRSQNPNDKRDIVEEYTTKETTPVADIVTLLLKEAKELVSKKSMESARVRLTAKLEQLAKAQQAVAELERQLEDLQTELRETL